jgi:hypothetical protein
VEITAGICVSPNRPKGHKDSEKDQTEHCEEGMFFLSDNVFKLINMLFHKITTK